MLNIYLKLARRTKSMIVFQAEEPTEGILYLPKPVWDVMGCPENVVVEVTPEGEPT